MNDRVTSRPLQHIAVHQSVTQIPAGGSGASSEQTVGEVSRGFYVHIKAESGCMGR